MVHVFFVPALPTATAGQKNDLCHPTMTSEKKSPFFSLPELREAGATMTLYPLSAIPCHGHCGGGSLSKDSGDGIPGRGCLLPVTAETRVRLYEILDYHRYERKLDEPFGSKS